MYNDVIVSLPLQVLVQHLAISNDYSTTSCVIMENLYFDNAWQAHLGNDTYLDK